MSKSKAPTQCWPAYTYFSSSVTGVMDFQPALRQLAGEHGDKKCRAVSESEVLSDGNGGFKVSINGVIVGALSTRDAEKLQERLSAMGTDGRAVSASAVIVGGHKLEDGRLAHYGVRLELCPSDLWPASAMLSD